MTARPTPRLALAAALALAPLGAALAPTAALAQAAPAARAPDAAAASVQRFYDGLGGAMRSGGGAAARYQALAPAVQRNFDLATMTRLAVGPRWSSIPGARQAALQQAFGRFLIATYSGRIGGYSGERFEVNPVSEPRAGGRLVRSRIVGGSGGGTRLDFLVGPSGRVIDVYVDGSISEVATRRAEFDAVLASGGPEALEADLRRRADRLAGG